MDLCTCTEAKVPQLLKIYCIYCICPVHSWGFQYCCSSGEEAELGSISVYKSPRKWSNSNPPFVGNNRDSPAFDLAEFSVRNVDLEGQAWHPHGDLQGSTQVLIGEVHQSVHLAFHLLAVDKNIVTPVRNLRGEGGEVIAVTKQAPSVTLAAQTKTGRKGSLLSVHANDGLPQREQLNTGSLPGSGGTIMQQMPKDCTVFMKPEADFPSVMRRGTNPWQCWGIPNEQSLGKRNPTNPNWAPQGQAAPESSTLEMTSTTG